MTATKWEYLKYQSGEWTGLFGEATTYKYPDANAAGADGWELDEDPDNTDGVFVFRRIATAVVNPPPPPPPPPTSSTTTTPVIVNAATIGNFQKFEATFDLADVAAFNPYFPYDAAPPMGVPGGGVSVDVLFSQDNFASQLVQPAFTFQDYTRSIQQNAEHLFPSGTRKWRVRFAPQTTGSYKWKIRVTDSSGTRYYYPDKDSFSCVASTNRGFIRVAKNDSRYFEFSDGSAFMPLGNNLPWAPSAGLVDAAAANMQVLASNGMNLSRLWITNLGIIGAAWSPWNSHHYPYDGYLPGNGISSEDAAPGHQYSIKLDTSHQDVFQGWFDNVPILPNRTYQLKARIKAVGLSGSGDWGFVVKKGGWMGPTNCHTPGQGTVLLGPVQATNGWQEFTAPYTSGSNEYFIGDLYASIQGVTAGKVFIDEISLKEDLGGGQFGPEVLKKARVNSHQYVDDQAARRFDAIVEKAEALGIYLKAVLNEKNDGLFGRLNKDGSIIADAPAGKTNQGDNNNFYSASGLNVRRLQEYYWRYCVARWGYSTAIHSWELINEGDPFNANHYDAANALATVAATVDAHQHLASTSNWHSAPVAELWGNPKYGAVGYGDSHAYINQGGGGDSGYILNGNTASTKGPLTGIETGGDTAAFVYEHSMAIAKKFAAAGQIKPYIYGEVGFKNGAGQELGNTDSADDTFLHQFVWAHLNPGAVSGSLYWFTANFIAKNRYAQFKNYANFLKGIPLNNGNFADIKLSVPSAVLAMGQKDVANGFAYFWLYDRGYTFANPGGGSNVNGLNVSFDGLPAKTYTVEWWDTWSGQVVSSAKVDHAGGTLKLVIPAVGHKDVACKVY